MPDPVLIPADSPTLQDSHEVYPGDVKARVLVDASGGPSSEIAQSLAVMGPGEGEALHSHDRAQSGYVIEGRGEVLFDGRTRDLKTGDTVFIPRDTSHGWRAGDDGMTMLVTFAADRLDDVATSRDATG